MRTAIVACGIARLIEIEPLLEKPDFRKSTRNMALAYSAVADLAGDLPGSWLKDLGNRLSVILGTNYGELDATIEFLKYYGASGVARPFLFQNSLHNATLGFLTQKLDLRGPGLTVSGRYFSGEDALGLALDLLHDGLASHVLIVNVDGVRGEATAHLGDGLPGLPGSGEGAGALLLSRAAEDSISPPLAWLEECRREPSAHPSWDGRYEKLSAIECLARALREESTLGELRLAKPDGSSSFLRFTKETR